MPKTWDQMSDPERIQDLRRDVVRLFDAINDLNHRLGSLGANLGRVETIAREAAKAVEKLTNRQLNEGRNDPTQGHP